MRIKAFHSPSSRTLVSDYELFVAVFAHFPHMDDVNPIDITADVYFDGFTVGIHVVDWLAEQVEDFHLVDERHTDDDLVVGGIGAYDHFALVGAHLYIDVGRGAAVFLGKPCH